MSYWDTSALLKLYVQEPDSGWFLARSATPDERIVTSVISETEVLCGLFRKERSGALPSGSAREMFENFLAVVREGRIKTVRYDRDVLSQAEGLVSLAFHRRRPVMIRSLDAIHLASALLSKASVVVSTDNRLRDVALLAGLRVAP